MYRGQRYGNRGLNRTELRVIELVAQGLKNNEVAQVLGTTQHVIKNYLKAIYDKLGFHNRVEVSLWYEARNHSEQTMN